MKFILFTKPFYFYYLVFDLLFLFIFDIEFCVTQICCINDYNGRPYLASRVILFLDHFQSSSYKIRGSDCNLLYQAWFCKSSCLKNEFVDVFIQSILSTKILSEGIYWKYSHWKSKFLSCWKRPLHCIIKNACEPNKYCLWNLW